MSTEITSAILTRTGNKINWNYDEVRKLVLVEKISTKVIASKAGVHIVTLQKYLRESGLAKERDEARKKMNDKFRNPSNRLTGHQRKVIQGGGIECPVCGKLFYPAPMHIYKDKRGRLTCNYTCARKGGWKG